MHPAHQHVDVEAQSSPTTATAAPTTSGPSSDSSSWSSELHAWVKAVVGKASGDDGAEGEVDRQETDPGDRRSLADQAEWVDEVEPPTDVEAADGDELPVDHDLAPALAGIGRPPSQEPRLPHVAPVPAPPSRRITPPEEVLLAAVGHEVAGPRSAPTTGDAVQPAGSGR